MTNMKKIGCVIRDVASLKPTCQESDQLAIYKRDREVVRGFTENNSSQCSPPD